MTVTTSAELIDRYGTCSEHLSTWVLHGYLRPVAGGGSGTRFEFDAAETLVCAALMTWRAAVPGASWEVLGTIAEAVRDQYPAGPPAESTSTLLVTVDVGPGVHLLLELEP